MLVKNILAKKDRQLITARPGMAIDQAMELLIENDIGCLPVVSEQGTLVGIISDKDIFKRIHETGGEYHHLKVTDVMSSELVVGLPEDELAYVAGMMAKNVIRHVPILEGEKMVGLISQRDISNNYVENMEFENRYLNLYMDSLHRRDQSGDI
jgi:CBS domain-containing protein